jgi:hypothetical protein
MATARRSRKRKHRQGRVSSLAFVVIVALVAVIGGGAQGASSTTSQAGQASLPTWRSFYDWSHGNGYVGWHTASSDPVDYGIQSANGGQYGLWLWAKGGQHVYTQTDYAEWTYTAPGTTRLLSSTLSFSYRNKLLAHHCIEVGYRTLAGVKVADEDFCQPAHPPDSQDLTNVHIADPNPGSPTAKVLFLRIHVDCGGAATCTKTIPTQAPLTNGNFVRFLGVDSTLVDDDLPVANPSGPLYDLHDHFIDGSQNYGVTLGARDAGSGIASSSLTHASTYPPQTDPAGTQNAPCDPAHNTPVLDARICPPEFSWQTTIDTNPLPEGPNTFTEYTTDVAGNLGSASWTFYIDRTPPNSVLPSGSLWDLAGQTTPGSTEFVTIDAHDPGAEVQKASGIASVWVEEVGVGLIDSSDNPDCTDLSCPDSYSATLPVELGGLAHGDHTFVVQAQDFIGHVTAGPSWTVTIAHDPGDDNVASDEPDDGSIPPGTDESPDGGAAGYDPATDPDPACDAYVDIGISDWCTDPTFDAPNTTTNTNPAADTQTRTSYTGCGVEAVFWSVHNPPTHLAAALAAHNLGADCAEYYFAHTAPGTRPECLVDSRGAWPLEGNFHAAPVFNWTAWADWVQQIYPPSPSGQKQGWYEAGLTFRRLMSDNGCKAGDKWFLNEMPTSWHMDWTQVPDWEASTQAGKEKLAKQARDQTQARIVAALHGLYQGPNHDDVGGFAADVVEGHNTTNFEPYKNGLMTAYGASSFWKTIRTYLDGFVKETYDRCSQVCVGGDKNTAAVTADKGVLNYSYHQRFLAIAAPSPPLTTTYAAVKTTLAEDYMPLLNAHWDSSLPVYDSMIRPQQMARLINEEVYAARRAATFKFGSAGRIGFAWDENYDDTDAGMLAENLAVALYKAYSRSGSAGAVCNTTNLSAIPPYYGCPPKHKTDAAFIPPKWDTFKEPWTP